MSKFVSAFAVCVNDEIVIDTIRTVKSEVEQLVQFHQNGDVHPIRIEVLMSQKQEDALADEIFSPRGDLPKAMETVLGDALEAMKPEVSTTDALFDAPQTPKVEFLGNGEVEVTATTTVKDEFQHGTGGTVEKIKAMFEVPKANGAKKATYRAFDLVLSLAPDNGSNPGAIYIKDKNAKYIGKITRNSKWINYVQFSQSPLSKSEVERQLHEISKNPKEVAVKYGHQMGICCCCGAELTDPVSVANGIGPICAEKWFGA